MPIKEIMSLSLGVFAFLFVTNPLHFKDAVRKVQFQILREVVRTDNWGNPSIFATSHRIKNSPAQGGSPQKARKSPPKEI